MLLRSGYTYEQYSYIFLVLPVSLSLIFVERRAKSLKLAWSLAPGLLFVLTSVLVLWSAESHPMLLSSDVNLSARIFGLVLCTLGLIILCYGIQFVKELLFPLMFLFLMIPLPQFLIDSVTLELQRASSAATFMLFRLAGVPVLRNGFILSIPTLDIEVAKECSGIRSSEMLFVTGLVLGHLYLRSTWAKVIFALVVIPLAIAKNAVRIFTLSMLAIRVDPDVLQGRLHRNGGIVFFLLTFAGILLLLGVLRFAENRTRNTVGRGSQLTKPNHIFSISRN
jgi:exosortase